MNSKYNEETEINIKNEIDENFVIKGRKINGFFENIAVTCDSFSNNLRFTMAETFDGVPLWNKERLQGFCCSALNFQRKRNHELFVAS